MKAQSINTKIARRQQEFYEDQRLQNYKQTDRMFAVLMVIQWVLAIGTALWISPRTWAGTNFQVHLHVWATLFLGGALTFYPVYLALTHTGQTLTRHVIGVSQMLMSALLIHLTGGRIETHFHVFGSLAFLAFYRDWKVLIPATIVVAVDHWIRGVYWPQSVYGILSASPWRWLEHAGWVIFEDIFLVISCLRQCEEMQIIAERAAKLESTNEIIEAKVKERTRELLWAKQSLENEMHERKRLEKVMLQSEKMVAVGQLAGGVAHEINNPLGIILGFAQSVGKRIQAGDPLEMPLKTIEREAMRCTQLVRDLLTFSRAEKTEKEWVDLQEAIEGALSLVLAQSRVKGIELKRDLEANIPKVKANRVHIQQIVINLCNNAIDAMPGKGVLTIRMKHASLDKTKGIRLDVEDTGQGIPEEIKSQIFNPFFTTKEVGRGTGLGLSLVYEIVQKHQGQITLDSKVGKGTTFHVFLPIEENGVHKAA